METRCQCVESGPGCCSRDLTGEDLLCDRCRQLAHWINDDHRSYSERGKS